MDFNTQQTCEDFCRHVVDVENEYWEKDGLTEDMVEELTIDTTEDSDDRRRAT